METRRIEAIAPDIWQRLADSPAKGDVLVARLAAPDLTDKLIAAFDADGKRHLLVTLRDEDSELIDRDSRGIDVATRILSVQGHDPARYIDMICSDPAGHAIFDLFGGEIAATLAGTDTDTTYSIATLLGKWRRFWGQVPLQILSAEEQTGLFAELWFLTQWFVPKIGLKQALDRWRGPFGSRHDFESAAESIEVKATTHVTGTVHRIHGIDQLAPPENGMLYFFSVKLREEAGGSKSLASVVYDARELCRDDGDAMSKLENALASAGYSDGHAAEYSKKKFRLVAGRLFIVRDDFPRLTKNHFTGGIPAGVDRIEYDIDLQSASHLEIADSPEKYFQL